MVMLALGMWAQSLTVTGVVMAQDEPDPVIGANVMVKGSTNGTITDFDGNFSIWSASYHAGVGQCAVARGSSHRLRYNEKERPDRFGSFSER